MDLGECTLHKLVQDCDSEMWALHQPSVCEHAWAAPPGCQSASSWPLILLSSESSGIYIHKYTHTSKTCP